MDISIALLYDSKNFHVCPKDRISSRAFLLPADAHAAGFIVDCGSGSGPPFRCLIIAGNCWFASPPQPLALIE